jgi:hypothetical protein
MKIKTNIYFIFDGKNIKIGKSVDLSQRMSQLQTANSSQLKILFYIPNMDDCFEKHVHHICSRFNIQGEWFNKKVIRFLFNHPWYKENIKKYES